MLKELLDQMNAALEYIKSCSERTYESIELVLLELLKDESEKDEDNLDEVSIDR